MGFFLALAGVQLTVVIICSLIFALMNPREIMQAYLDAYKLYREYKQLQARDEDEQRAS